MVDSIWSQDVFSKGELAPLMYARTSVTAYYNGLKQAKNVITYPQGAAGKRFGTLYQNTVAGVTDYTQISFDAFPYLNQCTYLVVIVPDNIYIYLEGTLVFTVTSTGIAASEVATIDTTVLNANFRIASSAFRPKDLTRSNNAANVITGNSDNSLQVADAMTPGLILPIIFTTSGALPTGTPQVRINQIYFVYVVDANTIEVYTTAEQAKARTGAYAFTNFGTTSNIVPQNNWTLSDVTFKNYPVYDFNDLDYSGVTFTPTALAGYNIEISASGGTPFSAKYIGGMFSGNGGIGRITDVTNSTTAYLSIVQDFASLDGIPGTDAVLAEPAWSDERGWPSKCSSFQSRAAFANTRSLANGLWLSSTNQYNNFDDLTDDDDDAISWFPSSDSVNYIRFIVPYRSLTIHTNTGIFSTPLSFETAITPNNFSMTLQDSTPATAIQPRAIDNQIVILSGNDVHSMLWDGFNNSYTSTIASVASEHLIVAPHDETAFTDLARAGSRYMFIVNNDGSLVIFQTLISENVQGFTPAYLEQTYGNAYFRWSTSTPEGRAWFLTERWLAEEGDSTIITGWATTSMTAINSNFSTTVPTLVKFNIGIQQPITNPQINSTDYYWVIAEDVNTFSIYSSQADALARENPFTISFTGGDLYVVSWPATQTFMIEELSFNVFVDCATVVTDTFTDTVSGLDRFNGQVITAVGDGFGFENTVTNGEFVFDAHGETVVVSNAAIGFPVNMRIVPMAVAPPGQLGYKGTSLPFPQHIRVASFLFVDTIGGEINGKPIALTTLNQLNPGDPPVPQTGFFQITSMAGWNTNQNDGIIITHSAPFDIKLAGIWYRIEG